MIGAMNAGWRGAVAPATVERAPAREPAGFAFFAEVDAAPAGNATERAAQLRQLRAQHAEVDRALCDYRAATRYPPHSRPLAEQSDQVYPNQPVASANALRSADGKSDPSVQIHTAQSRVFMVAGETVALSLRAADADGKPLALVVTRAVAQGMTYAGKRPSAAVALGFADTARRDGALVAVLAPAQTSLATFDGTIRAEVRFSVAGRQGVVLFDVIYSPEVPATWTGTVREVVEGGALVYVLKADVRQAGRYIVNGRIDDAGGKPVALATFNDVLGTGPNEIRLTVFGKLLHDQAPAMPLTLRDVDGYLLREDASPDRALMPRLEGSALAGQPHALESFSNEEWQSEERTRYLDEFGRDVARARAALTRFEPTLPAPASACGAAGGDEEGKIAP